MLILKGFKNLEGFYSKWTLDSVNEDSIIHNPNLRATLEAIMNDENSIASFSVKAMLDFVDNQLLEKTDLYEPVRIVEIDVYPEEAVAAKRDQMTDSEKELGVSEFFAYPNPTTGIINFDTKGVEGLIFVHDMRGQLISVLNNKKDQALVSFDGNNLSSGIYIASFKAHDNIIQTLRIVKQ